MRYARLATPAALLLAVAMAPAIAQQLPRPGQGGQPPAPQAQQRPAQGQQPAPPPQGAPQQGQPQQGQPAPVKPYKPVAVSLVPPASDPSLEAFRKQLGDIAQKKDRAALARLVVAKGFFWENESGNGADAKKSGVDNLAAAIGLDAKDGSGWEGLTAMAGEANVAQDPQKKGIFCGPSSPNLDDKAFEALTKATQTDPGEWAYPATAGAEVRQAAKGDAPVIEKLGVHLVRVIVDSSPAAAVQANDEWTKVATPSGKTGFVKAETLNSLVTDQICYIKEGGAWKIAGVVGGGGQN